MTLYSYICLWWISSIFRIYRRIYDGSPLEDAIFKDELPDQVPIPGICPGNMFSKDKEIVYLMTLPMLALIIHCYHFENESCFSTLYLIWTGLSHTFSPLCLFYLLLQHPFISVFHSDHALNLVFTSHYNRDNLVRLRDLLPLSLGKTIPFIHLEHI